MIQRGQYFRFTLKAVNAIAILREFFGKDLDCNFAFQLRIAGAIYLTHATFAEKRNDFVRSELGTNAQGHDFRGL